MAHMKNYTKYTKGFFLPPAIDMSWINKMYPEKAPTWCSVDLRDGNQALIIPMSLDEKIEFFKMLKSRWASQQLLKLSLPSCAAW